LAQHSKNGAVLKDIDGRVPALLLREGQAIKVTF
jgi:hypothetical protein